MEKTHIRKSITNAKFNEEQSNILLAEILIISVGIGLYSQSWWIFGSMLIGLLIAINIPYIAIFIIIILSLCWGVIGYSIGMLFSSTSASIVLAIIGVLSGLGVHLAALEWVKDIANDDKG